MKRAGLMLVAACGVGSLLGQVTTSPTTGVSGGSAPAPTKPNPSIPTSPATPARTPATVERPMFISGKVDMDDGSPTPSNITIQKVCNGTPRAVAYTDAKGHFSFQWGQNNGVMSDASETGFSSSRNSISAGFGAGNSLGGSSSMSEPYANAMMNCELRASVAGFSSSMVSLYSHTSMDIPDIGSIVLHRLANVEGSSVSATSLAAPKDAKKAYERGLQSLLKNKPEDAAKDFEKAVDVYPKYAEAWMNLGKVRILQRAYEPARNALMKAVEADAKLVSPYVELGLLAGAEQKWEDSSRFLDRAVRLDPIDFPQAWYADAVANYNLKKYDVAEKSAREAVKLDPKHQNPRADYLLGLVLIEKRDYAGAATELKTYLQLAPQGSDVTTVRNKVSELEHVLQK